VQLLDDERRNLEHVTSRPSGGDPAYVDSALAARFADTQALLTRMMLACVSPAD
jgi:hypothetical protein